MIVFISSIPTVRSISFNFDSILDITDCYHSYRCRLTQQNFSEKSGKIYTTGKHFSQLVVMTVATILTCDSTYFFSILLHCDLLIQKARLNLSVIPFLSLDLSTILPYHFPIISMPLFHDFHQFHQFHSFNLINSICFLGSINSNMSITTINFLLSFHQSQRVHQLY